MLEKPDKLVRYDPGQYRERFTFFFWVILVAVCLLVLRLWYLQIIKGEDLLKRSENNRIRIREVKAMRGIILRFPGSRSRGEPAVLRRGDLSRGREGPQGARGEAGGPLRQGQPDLSHGLRHHPGEPQALHPAAGRPRCRAGRSLPSSRRTPWSCPASASTSCPSGNTTTGR